MPLPLIPIAIGAAAISGGVALSQVIRTKKLRKVYEEARAHAEQTERRTQRTADEFKSSASAYGYAKAQASESLQQAAEFLKKATVKHRDFYVGTPESFQTRLEQIEFQAQTLQNILRTVAGPTTAAAGAAAPIGIYTAVGLFGVASTGTSISSLSGAAANSAILAAIGRAVGGAGMAAGAQTLATVATTLNIIALPISIGSAIWSVKKGNDTARTVENAVRELSTTETQMEKQISIMRAVIRRMGELRTSINSEKDLLLKQLSQSDPDNLEHAHAVYELADLLGRTIDAEAITPAQAADLGIKVNAPALPQGS